MAKFKVGDMVKHEDYKYPVPITAVIDKNYFEIRCSNVYGGHTWRCVEGNELCAYADISPLIARLIAAYNRAIIKDARVIELAREGRKQDAQDVEIMRDASALDFLRAFKALEDAMPDVFDKLKEMK